MGSDGIRYTSGVIDLKQRGIPSSLKHKETSTSIHFSLPLLDVCVYMEETHLFRYFRNDHFYSLNLYSIITE